MIRLLKRTNKDLGFYFYPSYGHFTLARKFLNSGRNLFITRAPGVVFNEMKGVFADSQTIFGEALLNSILPSNTYGHVSGGLPEKIPGDET